jgi:hypothetical protein
MNFCLDNSSIYCNKTRTKTQRVGLTTGCIVSARHYGLVKSAVWPIPSYTDHSPLPQFPNTRSRDDDHVSLKVNLTLWLDLGLGRTSAGSYKGDIEIERMSGNGDGSRPFGNVFMSFVFLIMMEVNDCYVPMHWNTCRVISRETHSATISTLTVQSHAKGQFSSWSATREKV